MFKMWCLTALLCVNLCAAYGFLEETEEPDSIYWPPEYKLSGEKFYLSSGIKEPFQIWYSSEYNKSRIDYYGGMVKKYYTAETEDSKGAVYEIHPISNEKVTNELVCYRKTKHGDQHNFLPDTDGYEHEGEENINGVDAQKWVSEYDNEYYSIKQTKTLWVAPNEEQGYAVPVRYEIKRYDTGFGSLHKHIIVNYYNFESYYDSGELEVDEDMYCKRKRQPDLSNLAFIDPDNDEHVEKVLNEFKIAHERTYKDQSEHVIRRNILRRNLELIISINRQNLGYKLALNHFADRTEEELKHLTTLIASDPNALGTVPFPYNDEQLKSMSEDIPDEVDLRLDGLVTPVRDQGACGSCWAFATVAALEGALARSNGGQTYKLSEQAFVDCAWGYSGHGCKGGTIDRSLKFAMKHGVPTEADYGPYLQMDGYCGIENMTDLHAIRGFTKVTSTNENALKVALFKHGPVAVAVYATYAMMWYSSGVFYDRKCENPNIVSNHAVTVVGYGKRDGETFWIVKNSWGPEWGEEGYILMSAKSNSCLLETQPYYAVV